MRPAAAVANEAGVGVIAVGFAAGDQSFRLIIREALIYQVQNLLFRHARVLQAPDLLACKGGQTLDAAMDDSLDRGIGEPDQFERNGFPAENVDLIGLGHFQNLLIGIARLGQLNGGIGIGKIMMLIPRRLK